ncbi:MAG: DUF6941 family protein [Ktedonobacterales bacterium]
MQIPLAVLADYANITVDGKLNIMGIFNTIFVTSSFPATHPQLQLVFQFVVPASERGETKRIDIKLLDADGDVLVNITSETLLPRDMPANQEIPQIVGLNGLVFPKVGDYAFSVLINGEEKKSVALHVLPIPIAPPSPLTEG